MDCSSLDAYLKSVQPTRDRLKKILGVVDELVPFTDLEYVGGPKRRRWSRRRTTTRCSPALAGAAGRGRRRAALEPKGKVVANVVAIPDADWTPEMLVGMAPGVPEEEQFGGHRRPAVAG